MALVDYTSSDSESGPDPAVETTVKKRKLSRNGSSSSKTCAAASENVTGGGDGAKSKAPARPMPPLPPAFHDLYASTVRVSTSDDPALHQGRKRVNPHKVGNWPTHLYIEWHPTPTERTHLTALLSDLQTAITTTFPSSSPIKLTSFLTSELSTPQPLHISLSRPIVLTTPQRDPFLDSLAAHAVRGSRLRAFDLVPRALAWHRSPESERTFLVLRVRSAATSPAGGDGVSGERGEDAPPQRRKTRSQNSRVTRSAAAAAAKTPSSAVPASTPDSKPKPKPAPNPNPELALLLRRCNDLVTSYSQPALYASPSSPSDPHHAPLPSNPDPDPDAFHISLAWTFAPPTAELVDLTERIAAPFFSPLSSLPSSSHQPTPSTTPGPGTEMRIRVDGVKAKIGNAVTHVELLPAVGRGGRRRGSSSGGREDEGVRNGVLGIGV
ncbi:U6 snRNA phosphodiesterase Usb1 [Camillea tinctor]|nr:U6 snRNA phosphodiesterase Usb1 [Camillea tinctor]